MGPAAEADSSCSWRSVQKLPVRSWAPTVWEVLAFFSYSSQGALGAAVGRYAGISEAFA